MPEHGLSLYIEANGQRILFDMGQTNRFTVNAGRLGIDLAAVDLAVLSHGHYDHGGGLKTFLEINSHAPVYMRREAFGAYFNGTEKYIGLDFSLQDCDRIVYAGDEQSIGKGLTLLSENRYKSRHEAIRHGLTKRIDGEWMPDDFRHEQVLLVEEAGRRVLISGCSHRGILDIMEWFRPDVMVGGFHFSKLPTDDWLAGAAKRLAAYDTDYYTCHCTGREQYEFMKKQMPRLHYLACGDSIVIGGSI